MKKTLHALALSLLCVITGNSVVAQLGTEQWEQEVLNAQQGAIFEIMATDTFTTPTYSWILTRNGEFLQAGRNQLFRTKLLQSGPFELEAIVRDETTNQIARRLFIIRTAEKETEDTESQRTSLLETSPPLDAQGGVRLNSIQQVLVLKPAPSYLYQIDTDVEFDSNGDGNPKNDDDSSNTLFTLGQAPLHIWVSAGRQPTIMQLIASQNTTPTPLTLSVYTGSNPSSPNPSTPGTANPNRPEITTQITENSEVVFQLNPAPPSDAPLLLRWSFGDGLESTLDSPIHRYENAGVYDVRVIVQDLTTGQILAEVERQFDATDLVDDNGTLPVDPEDDDDTEGGEASSEDSDGNGNNTSKHSDQESSGGFFSIIGSIFSSAILATILLVAVLVLVLVLVGWIVWALIARTRGSKVVQKTIAKMEKKLVESEPKKSTKEEPAKAEVIDTITPEAPSPSDPPAPMPVEPEVVEQVPPTPEPPADDTSEPQKTSLNENPIQSLSELQEQQEQAPPTETPSWLQEGIKQAEVTGQTVLTPPPETFQKEEPASPPPPPPANPPIPETIAEPVTPPVEETPVAPDLAPNPVDAPIAPAEPQAVAEPEPNIAPAPPPLPTPQPSAVSAPEPGTNTVTPTATSSDVPSWLQAPPETNNPPPTNPKSENTPIPEPQTQEPIPPVIDPITQPVTTPTPPPEPIEPVPVASPVVEPIAEPQPVPRPPPTPVSAEPAVAPPLSAVASELQEPAPLNPPLKPAVPTPASTDDNPPIVEAPLQQEPIAVPKAPAPEPAPELIDSVATSPDLVATTDPTPQPSNEIEPSPVLQNSQPIEKIEPTTAPEPGPIRAAEVEPKYEEPEQPIAFVTTQDLPQEDTEDKVS